MLLSSLGTSIANVALPSLVEAFGASFAAVQWVVLAYLLAVTTLVVSVGRLGDLWGRRRLLLAGIALFTVASLAAAASPDLPVLIAARAAQGLGAAVMMALSMALIGDAVPKSRAGWAMGFLGSMSAVGTALGPSLGGVLIGAVGWPAIFLPNLPLGVAAFVLAYRFLPRDPPSTATPGFDLAGSVLLSVVLAAYALAMTLDRGRLGPRALALLGVALAGAFGFVRVESTRRAPLIQPSLFRDKGIRFGFAMSALVTTVAMTTLVVGPFYLAKGLGLSPAMVGFVMTAGPLVAALVGVPAGRGVDRFGTARTTVWGLAAMASGAALLALMPLSSGVAGYVLPLVVVTGGFALFQAANNTAVLSGVDSTTRGLVSGVLNLSRNLGLITGASVMGAVFAIGTGHAQVGEASADAIARGMHIAFLVAAMLASLALALAIVLNARVSSRRSGESA
jgi:MFS family permease